MMPLHIHDMTNATKQAKWVLKNVQMNIFAGLKGVSIVPVETEAQATVFDGMDNPAVKIPFYEAITGIKWEAVSVS